MIYSCKNMVKKLFLKFKILTVALLDFENIFILKKREIRQLKPKMGSII